MSRPKIQKEEKKIVVDHVKAVIFVAHIQRHLNRKETHESLLHPASVHGMMLRIPPIEREIPMGKVGCKICNKSIDQIAFEDRNEQDWIVA